jgi:MinD superfamily P-loop ATPase
MKELVIISGKGGTGKTSTVAALARLAGTSVLADCDVDAADLHLVLSPRQLESHEYSGRMEAVIDADVCTGCGLCAEHCRFQAISLEPLGIDGVACEGCALCKHLCPADAIRMQPVVNGHWLLSDTSWGPLVHARLGVAEDNSGKLVTLVRNQARRIADEQGIDLLLVDGAPGIGCPVIASLSGATMVLLVTEPSVAGSHDLRRVLELVRHFRLPFAVCVNKFDLSTDQTTVIEAEAQASGSLFTARVRFDRTVTEAMVMGKSVVDVTKEGAAEDLVDLWKRVKRSIDRGVDERGLECV